MSFAELIGHQKQLTMLRAALAGGRLHHAYLFLGPEGVGKRTVALALARALHCQKSENDFCGGCANCTGIASGNHPDVRIVEQLTDKKEISIQQIREIERELNYQSFTGKRKIAIIDPATLMNIAAQNALLKTLEEPPKESLIILIALSAGALLPTLRSRCVRLHFAPLARHEIVAHLRTAEKKTGYDAEFLAALSMGSVGMAFKLDTGELVERRREWARTLDSLRAGDYQAAMNAAAELGGNRDEALSFLKWAESWYRDLLIYRVTRKSDELVNFDMLAEIERQAAGSSVEALCSSIEKAFCAPAEIQRNLNRRMILEDFLFNVVGKP